MGSSRRGTTAAGRAAAGGIRSGAQGRPPTRLNLVAARAARRSRLNSGACGVATWVGKVDEEVLRVAEKCGATWGCEVASRDATARSRAREVWRGKETQLGLAWKGATVLWALSMPLWLPGHHRVCFKILGRAVLPPCLSSGPSTALYTGPGQNSVLRTRPSGCGLHTVGLFIKEFL